MRQEPIETIEQEGFVARLYQDEEPESPKDWDQLGTLVTWSRDYYFDVDGQKRFGEPSDFLEMAAEKGWVYLPVGMIDHSGISLYVGSSSHPMDFGGWDSGQVGFIYATPESMRLIGTPAEEVEKVLAAEVEQWDQYVTGDVYGYVIDGPDGEHRDSCWGFYGLDYAKQEMKEQLRYVIEYERKEAAKIDGMMRV